MDHHDLWVNPEDPRLIIVANDEIKLWIGGYSVLVGDGLIRLDGIIAQCGSEIVR